MINRQANINKFEGHRYYKNSYDFGIGSPPIMRMFGSSILMVTNCLLILLVILFFIPFSINAAQQEEVKDLKSEIKQENPFAIKSESNEQTKEILPPPGNQLNELPKLGYHSVNFSFSFGGSGMGKGNFDQPVALGIDLENNIYIVDRGNNLIQKFDRNGQFLRELGKSGIKAGEFDAPSAIVIDNDKNCNIYIADTNNNRVQKYKYESLKDTFTLIDSSFGSTGRKLQNPVDLVLDHNNNLYILDAGNYCIQKFNQKGDYLKEWGSYGSGRESFLGPIRLAYDPTGFGYLYVLDHQRTGPVLHKIDLEGNFLKRLDLISIYKNVSPINKPEDVYIDYDGFLYLVDQGTGSIYKFNSDGECIQKIIDNSLSRIKDAVLKKPCSIIQDTEKRLIIIDAADSLVKIYDQN